MSHIFDSEFIEISFNVFKRIDGKLPFDVFIKRAANTYTKVFPKAEPIDAGRLATYVQKNVTSFHVNKEGYRQYLFYVEKIANNMFEKPEGTKLEDLVDLTNEMTNLTAVEMLGHSNLAPDTVEHAAQTVKGCVSVLRKDPASLAKIFKFLAAHPYSIRHSISTSVFSILLAKSMDLGSDKTLATLGTGAFLHDIGMAQISFDVEEKPELTPDEWKQVKEHPELGKRMLDSLRGISTEIKAIVLQHHEQPNGRGYPNGIRDKEIYMLAKIVAIADSFSALISKRPYRAEPFTPPQAIQIMREDKGKFDQKFLEKFSTFFGRVKQDPPTK